VAKCFMTLAAAEVLGTAIAPASVHAQAVLAEKGWIVDAALQQTLNSTTNHDGDAFTLAEMDTFFHHNPALKGVSPGGTWRTSVRPTPPQIEVASGARLLNSCRTLRGMHRSRASPSTQGPRRSSLRCGPALCARRCLASSLAFSSGRVITIAKTPVTESLRATGLR
jgi:hypothetical protein